MSSPVARFTPSRRYLLTGIAALAGTALSLWSALRWEPIHLNSWLNSWSVPAIFNSPLFSPSAFPSSVSLPAFNLSWIAVALFAIPAVLLFALALRPAIEIHDLYLRIGRRDIPWDQIRRLDQTGWNVPLLVYLTVAGESRVALIYPGDLDSSASLLRHLRRSAREALLDGVPYRQFWGEPPAAAPPRMAPLRYPLLRPEDEAEVERMFQRLKSVGHLEQRQSDADEE